MVRLTVLCAAAVSLVLITPLQAQPQRGTPAIVHVRIVDLRGDEIPESKVEVFKSDDMSDGRDFANRFRRGAALGIPFGEYHLQVHATGFRTAYREVLISQPDVWVILSLDPGGNDDSERYELTGALTGSPEIFKDVWVRASGVLSGAIVDIKPDKEGRLRAGGLSAGIYTLATYRGTRVLDVRTAVLPSMKPISINVDGGK